MVDINASTTVKVAKKVPAKPVGAKTTTAMGAPKKLVPGVGGAKKAGAAALHRGAVAPLLKPATLTTPALMESNLTKHAATDDAKKLYVADLFRKVMGEQSFSSISTPHAASTTRDRGGAAADLAVVAKEWGVSFVLKECCVLNDMQRNLFPEGIEALIGKRFTEGDSKVGDSTDGGGGDNKNVSGLKPSASAVSLSSMDNELGTSGTSVASLNTDASRTRGHQCPPNAREGCLLLIRALLEANGRQAEPYLVGAFYAAAMDECSSSSGAVREAAEDSCVALIQYANAWATPSILIPLSLQALHSKEWRVKVSALERIAQLAVTTPKIVYKLIPTIIPQLTDQVWVTKAQVSKAAKQALLAVCNTNTNPDIKACVPAVVNAICKPADTNKAVTELMGTTFVVPVDASTLAILCPVLARALKEKMAIHKRAACLVISNMAKLVETPQAVAPFGSLLVPELKRVSENVQFEEIRDEALKALANLTKALGALYNEDDMAAGQADEMKEETKQAEAEQDRIRREREEFLRKEEEIRKKEEEEKRRFKEAMDAQRELDKLSLKDAEERRKEEEVEKEKQKLSTKTASGKCQGCGLKKCKKTCSFYPGN